MTEPRAPYGPSPLDAEADRLTALAERLRNAVANDIRPRPDCYAELKAIAKVVDEAADGLLFLGIGRAWDGHALKTADDLDEAALSLKQFTAETRNQPRREV